MDSHDPYLHLSKYASTIYLERRSPVVLLWLRGECVCFMASSLQSTSSAWKQPRTLTTDSRLQNPVVKTTLFVSNRYATVPIEIKAATNAKVRWSWLCRSGKVRGWHFNCAYVIYGACRASLAKLFETETEFIGLGWSSDPETNAWNCPEEWRISTDKQTYFVVNKQEHRLTDAPWSELWLYSAEWQHDVILLSKAELRSYSVTLPLNQLMTFPPIIRIVFVTAWNPQTVQTPPWSLQHVEYIGCPTYSMHNNSRTCVFMLNLLSETVWR